MAPQLYFVTVERGLLSREIMEIARWLACRAGTYEGDYYPNRSLYRFTDPNTAIEFRIRWC